MIQPKKTSCFSTQGNHIVHSHENDNRFIPFTEIYKIKRGDFSKVHWQNDRNSTASLVIGDHPYNDIKSVKTQTKTSESLSLTEQY